jgi:hypothetical protein
VMNSRRLMVSIRLLPTKPAGRLPHIQATIQ